VSTIILLCLNQSGFFWSSFSFFFEVPVWHFCLALYKLGLRTFERCSVALLRGKNRLISKLKRERKRVQIQGTLSARTHRPCGPVKKDDTNALWHRGVHT
jgi:hypothetical protein